MNDHDVIAEAIRLVDKCVAVTFPVNGQNMLPFIIGGKENVILQKPTVSKMGDIKARVTHVVSADDRKHDLYNGWKVLAARLWYWLLPVRRYLLAIYRRI